jgi:predicted CXXCH cytochrome family protein
MVLFFVALLVSGCDRKSRYQVMTTVFTGVPPYEEYYADKPEEVDVEDSAASDGPKVYMHPVYEARLCTSCHKNVDSARSDFNTGAPEGLEPDPSAPPPDLLLAREKLCTASCHIDKTPRRAIRENLWLHNPVAQGKCLDCHEPHQSTNPFQLKLPEAEVCISCHAPDSLTRASHLDKTGNEAELAAGCLTCHTVHMGADSQLLASEYKEMKMPVMMPAR